MSSKKMNIEETYRTLLRHLPEHYVLVLRPDLPNLLRGPDLMIGGEGRLFAIFKFQAAEQRAPDRLLVRLALARLALPRHAVCVLLGDSEHSGSRTVERTAPHFHSAIFEDWTTVLSHQILDPDIDGRAQPTFNNFQTRKFRNGRAQPIPPDIQGRQYHRAAALMGLSEIWLKEAFPRWLTQESSRPPEWLHANDGAPQTEGPSVDLFDSLTPSTRERLEPVRARSWSRGTRRAYPALLEYDDVILGAASGARLNDRLARFSEQLLLRTAALDNGIPYPQVMTHNLLVVDRVPMNRFDPLKTIRASCFAGWSLIGPHQLDQFDQTLQELKTLRE